MLTREELAECYEAYAHGEDVGRLAARYGTYPAELQRAMADMAQRKAMRSQADRANTLGTLNFYLFDELDRLDAADPSDQDAFKAETERAKAVEGIAKTVIESANTMLDAVKLRAAYTQQVGELPKMLEG